MLKFSGSGDIKNILKHYFESFKDLDGKVVIDIPAGSGFMTDVLRKKGAKVDAYDLFPEFFVATGDVCKKADLSAKIPLDDKYADYLLCQEGIEHLADQFFALKEFNRLLKPEGKLLITTPSISHLRAKLSNFLAESELYSRAPANELDAVWFSGEGETYFGHIFLIGIQKLRVLAKLAGFKIVKIHPVKISNSSIILGDNYPLIFLVNLYIYFASMSKKKDKDRHTKKMTYWEIFKLNIHPTILFGKHLFVEFEKECELSEVDLSFPEGQKPAI